MEVRARPTLVALLVAACMLGTVPSAEAVRGLSFSPRNGGPRETFVVSFIAPFRTDPYVNTPTTVGYQFTARGPRGCREVTGTESYQQGALARGDRAVIVLIAQDSVSGGQRGTWCRGRYVGHVDYYRQRSDGTTTYRRLVSNIRFSVRDRRPVGRLTLFPRLATPRDTLIARFAAPFPTSPGAEYEMALRHRRCGVASVGDVYSGTVNRPRRGEAVTIAVTLEDHPYRQTWCRGRWVGHIDYVTDESRRRVFSNLVFRIDGKRRAAALLPPDRPG